jgi:hypothetical protein
MIKANTQNCQTLQKTLAKIKLTIIHLLICFQQSNILCNMNTNQNTRCFGRVSSSYSTRVTHNITLSQNLVNSHNRDKKVEIILFGFQMFL